MWRFGEIRRAKVAHYIVANKSYSENQLRCIPTVDYIQRSAVFEQCRGSNAINNGEYFARCFPFDRKTMYFDVRNQ